MVRLRLVPYCSIVSSQAVSSAGIVVFSGVKWRCGGVKSSWVLWSTVEVQYRGVRCSAGEVRFGVVGLRIVLFRSSAVMWGAVL